MFATRQNWKTFSTSFLPPSVDVYKRQPFYYSKPDDHIGPPITEFTRRELEERAAIGEEYMRELLDKARLDELMLALRHLQEYMREIVEQHYDHLPKNPYSCVNPFYRAK